jgi:hypothetical protein
MICLIAHFFAPKRHKVPEWTSGSCVEHPGTQNQLTDQPQYHQNFSKLVLNARMVQNIEHVLEKPVMPDCSLLLERSARGGFGDLA